MKTEGVGQRWKKWTSRVGVNDQNHIFQGYLQMVLPQYKCYQCHWMSLAKRGCTLHRRIRPKVTLLWQTQPAQCVLAQVSSPSHPLRTSASFSDALFSVQADLNWTFNPVSLWGIRLCVSCLSFPFIGEMLALSLPFASDFGLFLFITSLLLFQ